MDAAAPIDPNPPPRTYPPGLRDSASACISSSLYSNSKLPTARLLFQLVLPFEVLVLEGRRREKEEQESEECGELRSVSFRARAAPRLYILSLLRVCLSLI